jgi:hypothetical protein
MRIGVQRIDRRPGASTPTPHQADLQNIAARSMGGSAERQLRPGSRTQGQCRGLEEIATIGNRGAGRHRKLLGKRMAFKASARPVPNVVHRWSAVNPAHCRLLSTSLEKCCQSAAKVDIGHKHRLDCPSARGSPVGICWIIGQCLGIAQVSTEPADDLADPSHFLTEEGTMKKTPVEAAQVRHITRREMVGGALAAAGAIAGVPAYSAGAGTSTTS